MSNDNIKPLIVSVKELLEIDNLAIPSYQRPYKWGYKNIHQLINDIIRFSDKEHYRLGTIVLHKDENKVHNIVDGQQRTISLYLLIKALLKSLDAEKSLNFELPKLEVSDTISKRNIRDNYREIVRLTKGKQEDFLSTVLEKCQVVVFVLQDLSEAFQFFDSQNARGKDLEPHDLLKAYHLREFSNSIDDKMKYVEMWESKDDDTLVTLFQDYLFRIKSWSKNRDAYFFTKKHIDTFKGTNLNDGARYPYMKSNLIAHHYIHQYNKAYDRCVDGQSMEFPFQLDGHVINGERFFEFVSYYDDMLGAIKSIGDRLPDGGNMASKKIIRIINNYDKKNRLGDQYVRMLFDCALLYYVDRFGFESISDFILKAFNWAYSLRLKKYAVSLKSINKYALSSGLFQRIREANCPSDVLHMKMIYVTEDDIERKELISIISIFEDAGCYEENK